MRKGETRIEHGVPVRSMADVSKNFTHLAVPHGHCFLLQVQGLQKFLYGLRGGRRDELKVGLTTCQDAGERSKTGTRGSPTGRGKCGRGEGFPGPCHMQHTPPEPPPGPSVSSLHHGHPTEDPRLKK